MGRNLRQCKKHALANISGMLHGCFNLAHDSHIDPVEKAYLREQHKKLFKIYADLKATMRQPKDGK